MALQELTRREQEGQLDEGFLSEVNAQLRQVWMFLNNKFPSTIKILELPLYALIL